MSAISVIAVLLVAAVVLVFVLRSRRSAGLRFAPASAGKAQPMSASQVIAECRKAGLSSVADQLEKASLPCIRLIATPPDKVTRPFRTQIGGLPDLPEPGLWPKYQGRSLSFVAQINLAELPHDDAESDLPRTGMLYFFYDNEQSTWGFDPKDKGSWRVLYAESLPQELPEATFPDDLPALARYRAMVLKAVPDTSIPDPFEDETKSDLSKEQQNLVLDFYGRYAELGPPKHQLLGQAMPIQGDMRLECQLASHGLYCGDPTGYNDPRARELEAGVQDWRLLLQVDSDDDARMRWGDVGRLYFWICAEDLRERRFDAVWMILQCT